MFGKLGLRVFLLQAMTISSSLASPFMIWKGLSLVTNTESPVVVVLSGSMEPAFYRGDILFLTNPRPESEEPQSLYKTGDILVYKIPGKDIPIVHRVIEAHDFYSEIVPSDADEGVAESTSDTAQDAGRGGSQRSPRSDLKQLMLTKGDNNPVDDLGLYDGLDWLERRHIVGRVRGYLPYVGYISIFLNEARQLLLSRPGAFSLKHILYSKWRAS
ncbi:hypothetical protein K435DRAFT_780493 [Dendrothele bispora CBS 962.96]|uniref:Signal peptidase complex catalytic subunit SEC11 n=1 Tax=Dendrothele bispora (strain CBS 962.96) TaxID=1314807 RepID=A0A4V6T5B0_DENBC|nr:hypothetical protein K435DRAFT_780493 [Dendrothele bispora CBS 962.96]